MDKLVQSFRDMVDSVVAAAPQVVMGILLVIAALIVAKIVEKILRMILVRVEFDGLIERAGVDKTLQKVGIRQELNHFIPRLAYFLILFLLARTAADALGLEAISAALGSFFSYLPNLIAAMLLVILGTAAAQSVGTTVTQAGRDAGLDFAPALGRVVSAAILFIVGMMAIAQLKIDTEIIRLVTAFCLACMALAFGLSFGLGTRDITRNILAGFYARKILLVGQPVGIRGQHGMLKAVTPTHTLIEADEQTISIAKDTFLDEISSQ